MHVRACYLLTAQEPLRSFSSKTVVLPRSAAGSELRTLLAQPFAELRPLIMHNAPSCLHMWLRPQGAPSRLVLLPADATVEQLLKQHRGLQFAWVDATAKPIEILYSCAQRTRSYTCLLARDTALGPCVAMFLHRIQRGFCGHAEHAALLGLHAEREDGASTADLHVVCGAVRSVQIEDRRPHGACMPVLCKFGAQTHVLHTDPRRSIASLYQERTLRDCAPPLLVLFHDALVGRFAADVEPSTPLGALAWGEIGAALLFVGKFCVVRLDVEPPRAETALELLCEPSTTVAQLLRGLCYRPPAADAVFGPLADGAWRVLDDDTPVGTLDWGAERRVRLRSPHDWVPYYLCMHSVNSGRWVHLDDLRRLEPLDADCRVDAAPHEHPHPPLAWYERGVLRLPSDAELAALDRTVAPTSE